MQSDYPNNLVKENGNEEKDTKAIVELLKNSEQELLNILESNFKKQSTDN